MGSDAFFPQRLATCGLGPELRAILRVAALPGADRFIRYARTDHCEARGERVTRTMPCPGRN